MIEAEDFVLRPDGRHLILELRTGDIALQATLTHDRLTQIRDAFAQQQVNLNAANARLKKALRQPLNRHERRKAARCKER